MLGVGFSEIVIIALVCFIAVGPKQLPIVMRKIAIYYRQFLTMRDDLKFKIMSADQIELLSEQEELPPKNEAEKNG